MSGRTLVITLGQLRAHQLTWANFKENVLDQLNADLAVCVPNDAFFDFTNPFYVNARFRWLIPDAPDLSDTFDRIQRLLGGSGDWRVLCDVPDHWIGRIAQSNQTGAAAILFILRWFMLDNIRADRLTEVYDRFVITRSDYYFLCPHPPLEYLDAESLWVPDGEDYGGLCDRHLVVSATNLVASCNLIDELLLRPSQMREAMIEKFNTWNIEKVIAFHLTRNGLISRVKRFPYVMFLVRARDDPTATGTGNYMPDMDMVVKYTSELYEAERYRRLIASNEDWRLYFASQYFADSLPARIYTSHRTMFYVDEDTGDLRHGPLADSPANAFFVFENSGGRIIHRSDGRTYHTISLSDNSRSFCRHPLSDDSSQAPTLFERVPARDRLTATHNLVGLRAGELYLSAEPDGRVTLNRRHCLSWEQFRLISDPKEKIEGSKGGAMTSAPACSLIARPVNARTNEGKRFQHYVAENRRHSKAQLFQDLWVLFESSYKRNGYFVEFGAGNGIDDSNTYLLEKEHGWSGIVAEPNPVHWEALKRNRKCYISTKCITSVSNETVTFIQADDPIYSSMEKYALMDMHAEARRHGTKIVVETLSLTDLLIGAKAPKKIDYLSIDTEGSELEILTNFDWSAYDIRMISVEHNFTPHREMIFALLKNNDYERKFMDISKWDDWYVKIEDKCRST